MSSDMLNSQMMSSQMMSSQMMSSQMLSMAFLKDNVNIYQILFSLLMMQLMTYLPYIKKIIMNFMNKRFNTAKKQLIRNYTSKKIVKEIKSSITFTTKRDKKNDNNYTIDAINYYITNLNESKNLHFVNDFLVINDKEFEISKDVYCIVETALIDTDEIDESEYSLKIYSYVYELEKLKMFIEELKKKYLYEQKNKLGTRKFYFDEHHVSLPKDQKGKIRFDMAPSNLTFTMTEFNTNKSLKNIFGRHLNIVKERIDLFVNHPEWYEEKGIPYTLGILLYGPPGTGKTSLIKAIAKDTKRHIFNIKLQKDTTQTQMKNLLFEESITINKNKKTEIFNIPLDERIYVIEDIDCLSDIVYSRSENISSVDNNIDIKSSNTMNKNEIQSYMPGNTMSYIEYNKNSTISDYKNNTNIVDFKQDDAEDSGESLNLSFLLNLLDGILETPGRILIITSNHPEKLDRALIRPGRIDININVGVCNIEMISEMFFFFFKKQKDFNIIKHNNSLTPAEMNKILLDNFNNAEEAYEEIINRVR